MDFQIKHFIRLNENKIVTHVFSTAFYDPSQTDICVNENGGRHFELNGEINPTIIDENGIYLYKYENGEFVKRLEEERLAEYEANKPIIPDPYLTLEERIDRLELLTLQANEVI